MAVGIPAAGLVVNGVDDAQYAFSAGGGGEHPRAAFHIEMFQRLAGGMALEAALGALVDGLPDLGFHGGVDDGAGLVENADPVDAHLVAHALDAGVDPLTVIAEHIGAQVGLQVFAELVGLALHFGHQTVALRLDVEVRENAEGGQHGGHRADGQLPCDFMLQHLSLPHLGLVTCLSAG